MASVEPLMRRNFLEYASYVIVDRAIPDPMDYEWYAGSESFGGGLVDMTRSLGASIAGVFEADQDAPA